MPTLLVAVAVAAVAVAGAYGFASPLREPHVPLASLRAALAGSEAAQWIGRVGASGIPVRPCPSSFTGAQ
jgi:hypothetical protein